MNRLILAIVAIVALVAPVRAVGGPTAALLGTDAELQARFGVRPLERTEVGVGIPWQEKNNLFGVGLYVTYDLMQEQQFNIFGTMTVPATLYVGGFIGAQDAEEMPPGQEADAFCTLMTGLHFGDGTIRIGPEYQYGLSDGDLNWSALGSPPDQHKVLLNLIYRFGGGP